MTKEWLNKILSSQEKFGMVWLINTVILIIAIAIASTNRPLSLYTEVEGQIEKVTTEYISYHRKTTVSYYSTVIHYKNNERKNKLVLGYVIDNQYTIQTNDYIKAWFYKNKRFNLISQLIVNDILIVENNKKFGITVWIVGLISLILEVFIVRHYIRNWTFKIKPKRNK